MAERARGERLQIMLSAEELVLIDNFRFAKRMPSRPATVRDWLRRQCEEGAEAPERTRRIDSDAAAVQILTVWGAKGFQFPIVYLPFAFNRHIFPEDIPLYP